jgi:hypothetical protein
MATKNLTPLQIFKETKRLDAIKKKLDKDQAALREKIRSQRKGYQSNKICVNNIVYKVSTFLDGAVALEELGTVEEFNKLLD